jgi:hypothetical protein
MGRGKAKGAAIVGLIGALALLAAGCGESRHENEQRPQVSTHVSVTIGSKELIVQPVKIGANGARSEQIPQNENHAQPATHSKGPLNVTFVVANQTTTDTKLMIRGGKDAKSEIVYGHSPASFQANLPTGSYTITAVNLPDSQPASFTVGSYRASSQNDVLLP